MVTRQRNRVRERREQAGLTQTELARRARVSRQTLSAIEKDDGYQPTAAVMGRLTDALADPRLFWREALYDPADDEDTTQG